MTGLFIDELLTKCKKAACLAVRDSQKPADSDDNLEDKQLDDEHL